MPISFTNEIEIYIDSEQDEEKCIEEMKTFF